MGITMLFNSIDFLFFLPIVFILYWFIFNNNIKVQNFLLLISSYFFYGWWDWRLLFLIFISTLVDYYVGQNIYISKNRRVRKFYLSLSIIFNLTLLGFFKYFNFFIDSWVNFISLFGYNHLSTWTLNIVLPIGISFYTFQTMSYSLDIYYNKLKPTWDFISFASFVSFFPQLVAGPIERASNLLPQILSKRKFKYEQGVQGLRLILWGLFKKVVIADSLSWRVNYCFENFELLDGGTLFLGLIYFSIQIYCDFSGYSDIAIGTAKLFGIKLMSNFKFPYFSRNIGEFWRRWHISLSTWFRDYMYIPLGGSKGSIWFSIRNIFLIFIISGLWHGANWKFMLWGLIHSLFYIPLFLVGKNRKYIFSIVSKNNILPTFRELLQMLLTFSVTSIAWVFFRADSVSAGFQYLINMILKFSIPQDNRSGILFVIILIIFDWTFKKNERNPLNYKNKYFRRLIYLFLSYLVFAHFQIIDLSQFIYFQF